MIVEAQWVAERRGRERFVVEQPPYSMLVRGIERDVLPVAQRYGMGVIPWSPLAGGWLSGRFGARTRTTRAAERRAIPGRYDLSLPGNQRKLDSATRSPGSRTRPGITLIQLALAFVLEHPAISSAIIGPRTMEHLEGQLSARVRRARRRGPRQDRRARPTWNEPQRRRRRLEAEEPRSHEVAPPPRGRRVVVPGILISVVRVTESRRGGARSRSESVSVCADIEHLEVDTGPFCMLPPCRNRQASPRMSNGDDCA